MLMNSRLAVRLTRVKKRHKYKFVPRLLSMIVGGSGGMFSSNLCILGANCYGKRVVYGHKIRK